MELSASVRRAINRYDPVKTEGLTLAPILMGEYESFLKASPAISFLPRSLPLKYLSEPLLAAFYRMEYDALEAGQESPGLFYRCVLFLALALRLGEGETEVERMKRFQVRVDPSDPAKLLSLEAGEEIRITPIQFQRLRPILAAQNGVDLPSDDANPELVEAERDIAAQRGPKLDISAEGMISSVAALTGTEEREIDQWPVLKFNRRKDAISRVLHFLVCGIGEASGAKFKGGNPYPSPFFDKVNDGSAALVSLDSFAGGAGKQAVQQAGGAMPPAPINDFWKGVNRND